MCRISLGAANNSESGSGESEVESEMYNPCIELFSDSESSETTESSIQCITFKQLDIVYKASLHLRRAMVLPSPHLTYKHSFLTWMLEISLCLNICVGSSLSWKTLDIFAVGVWNPVGPVQHHCISGGV